MADYIEYVADVILCRLNLPIMYRTQNPVRTLLVHRLSVPLTHQQFSFMDDIHSHGIVNFPEQPMSESEYPSMV